MSKPRHDRVDAVDHDTPAADGVIVPAPPRTLPALVPVPDPFGGARMWRTNIDESAREGQALIIRCQGSPDLGADDVMGQVIHVTHAYCEAGENVDDDTGEVSYYPRTVLVVTDGKTVGFGSAGVLRSLQTLVRFYGSGPWEPPLPLRLRQQKTGKNRRYYVLDLVTDQAAPKTARKG